MAEGVYGHGDLMVEGQEKPGWIVYDVPVANGLSQKICANGIIPNSSADIDFVYAGGEWYKLRSGTGYLSEQGFRAEPAIHKWKNLIPTKVTFPVKRPDLPYRLKVMWSKFWSGGVSPREYLLDLRKSNWSCMDMPAP